MMENIITPEACYWGRVLGHEPRVSRQGNPQIVLMVEFYALAPYSATQENNSFTPISQIPDGHFSRRIFWTVTQDREDPTGTGLLLRGSVHWIQNALRQLGYDRPTFLEMQGFVFDRHKPNRWRCHHETWDGQLRERWSLVSDPPPNAATIYASLDLAKPPSALTAEEEESEEERTEIVTTPTRRRKRKANV